MKLPNAPLKEVIFEVFWEIGVGPFGEPIDDDFELALGIFASSIKEVHPKRVRLKNTPEGVQMYGVITNQFWKDESTWPVVQIGSGIMAVNDIGASYDWENGYFQLIQDSLSYLEASYDKPLKFNRVHLRYMDAVNTDLEYFDFLKENLKTNIVHGFDRPGSLEDLHLYQTFKLSDDSRLNININNAKNGSAVESEADSIMWTTSVYKTGSFNKEEIITWASSAHLIASDIFKQMASPDFYKTFEV